MLSFGTVLWDTVCVWFIALSTLSPQTVLNWEAAAAGRARTVDGAALKKSFCLFFICFTWDTQSGTGKAIF